MLSTFEKCINTCVFMQSNLFFIISAEHVEKVEIGSLVCANNEGLWCRYAEVVLIFYMLA